MQTISFHALFLIFPLLDSLIAHMLCHITRPKPFLEVTGLLIVKPAATGTAWHLPVQAARLWGHPGGQCCWTQPQGPLCPPERGSQDTGAVGGDAGVCGAK